MHRRSMSLHNRPPRRPLLRAQRVPPRQSRGSRTNTSKICALVRTRERDMLSRMGQSGGGRRRSECGREEGDDGEETDEGAGHSVDAGVPGGVGARGTPNVLSADRAVDRRWRTRAFLLSAVAQIRMRPRACGSSIRGEYSEVFLRLVGRDHGRVYTLPKLKPMTSTSLRTAPTAPISPDQACGLEDQESRGHADVQTRHSARARPSDRNVWNGCLHVLNGYVHRPSLAVRPTIEAASSSPCSQRPWVN